VTRVVAIAANSTWNILNFRRDLIRAIERQGYAPLILSPLDDPSISRATASDIPWKNVSIDRAGLNPLADLRLFLAYRRILRRVRPAVFLGFTIKPNIYGGLAARTLGIPAIANISGLGTSFIKGGPLKVLVRQMYRRALASACVVFFQNPDDLNLFVSEGIVGPGQARLIPGSGIDLDHFRPAPLARGPVTFLLIARLLGDKGVREFVEAARLLRPAFADVKFQLLGDLDPGNRTSIGRAELQEWVGSGIVEHFEQASDVRPYIEDATAIVLPSYREGLPRTLLEGAAMARPLIATNVPGCREMVERSANGFLCEPKDAESLAASMKEFLLLSWEERDEMGSKSRQKVERGFSQEVVSSAYIEAIKQCLGEEPA
jgi:glycosyltransferase involved in cell wall biosynthesis